MIDFQTIVEKVEFMLDEPSSWIELLDLIAYYGNCAFVAFRHIIFEYVSQIHIGCDYGYYGDQYLTSLFYPQPELYQWSIHSQFLTKVRYRNTKLFPSIAECINDMSDQHDYVPYLTRSGSKPIYVIESIPISAEKPEDFFCAEPKPRYGKNLYILGSEFVPGY